MFVSVCLVIQSKILLHIKKRGEYNTITLHQRNEIKKDYICRFKKLRLQQYSVLRHLFTFSNVFTYETR